MNERNIPLSRLGLFKIGGIMTTQTINVPISDMAHSKMHERNIDHKHNGENTIVVEVVFNETEAYGVLELDKNHTFDLHKRGVPVIDEDSKAIIETEIYNGTASDHRCKIKTNHVNIKEIVLDVVNKTLVTKIDVNSIIKNIRKRMESGERSSCELRLAEKTREMLHRKQQAEKQADEKARTKKREENERKQNKIIEERELRDETWINEFGSERLKKAHAMNCTGCDKLLAEEVGKHYLPHYILDFDATIKASEATECPDEQQIDEIERLVSIGLKPAVRFLPDAFESIGTIGDYDGINTIEVVLNEHYYYKCDA